MQNDLLELVRSVKSDALSAEPLGGGRAIDHILIHVAESETVYLRYLVGKVNLLSDALRIVQENPSQPVPALTFLWEVIRTRLEQLTNIELSQTVPHGQVTWTARRALRRILEHTWEHLQEINHRLSANID
ncbi:MAG: DinB family protein [Anaerolineaceae bacterium]|nr:DinB family protein [Anaerolineaceae bacterium]